MVDINELQSMTRIVEHRGPDGSGIWINDTAQTRPWVGLGHTRLSIIDLSEASSQPFRSLDRKHIITFNGEIYNYLELRTQLSRLGHQFRTSGDTEVLLNSMIEWGRDALPRLRGMFSFVYVNTENSEVIAARDEFGIKPLYQFVSKDNIYFASEIKQFGAITGHRNRINHELAADFLLYGLTDHRRETMFDEIYNVLPGECITINGSRDFEIDRFGWRSTSTSQFDGTYGEACAEYRRLLLDSVGVHLRSDVEIGSCLSGGLDSSVLVGIASQQHSTITKRQHTFTATSEDGRIDEKRYADAVIQMTGSTPHFIQPTAQGLWDSARDIAWYQDEPFGSTSIFAQWSVFEAVKSSQIKVMLDGQGADEQLGGYNSFIFTYLGSQLRQANVWNFGRSFLEFRRVGRVNSWSMLQYLAYSSLSTTSVRRIGRSLGIASQNHLGWVNPQISDALGTNDPYRYQGRVPRTVRELSTDMIVRSNLPMLLRFEDRNSMAHSVEARVPFVDGPLMHFAMSLPADYLMNSKMTKPILRDAVGDFMPRAVRERRDKIGFQTAEQMWFRENPAAVKSLVDEAIDRLPTVFNSNTRLKVDMILSAKEPFNNVPWRVISTLFWAQAHDIHE